MHVLAYALAVEAAIWVWVHGWDCALACRHGQVMLCAWWGEALAAVRFALKGNCRMDVRTVSRYFAIILPAFRKTLIYLSFRYSISLDMFLGSP